MFRHNQENRQLIFSINLAVKSKFIYAIIVFFVSGFSKYGMLKPLVRFPIEKFTFNKKAFEFS